MAYSRMAAIAAMVTRGEKTADIGTDHALLALYLLSQEMVPRIIVSDLAKGPCQRARQAVEASKYGHLIEVRQGNGLQILHKGEVYNVILAGMGGDTIVDILSFDLNKAQSYKHYVLQPMSKPQVVRKFLAEQGWPIIKEALVKENNRLFVVMSTRPGEKRYQLSSLEMDIGPFILKNHQDLGQEYLCIWLVKYRQAMAGLEKSNQSEDEPIKKQYAEKISKLEAILNDY